MVVPRGGREATALHVYLGFLEGHGPRTPPRVSVVSVQGQAHGGDRDAARLLGVGRVSQRNREAAFGDVKRALHTRLFSPGSDTQLSWPSVCSPINGPTPLGQEGEACGSPELGGRLCRVLETESFTGKDCRRLETQAFPLKDKIFGPPEMPPELLVLSKVSPLSLPNQLSQGTQMFAEEAPSRQFSHGSQSRAATSLSLHLKQQPRVDSGRGKSQHSVTHSPWAHGADTGSLHGPSTVGNTA